MSHRKPDTKPDSASDTEPDSASDTKPDAKSDTKPDTKHQQFDELSQTFYNELLKLAQARLRRMKPGQTLQPTELVHEAFLRLKKQPDAAWQSRGHLFGAAAHAMRNVLVDYARRKSALRHGGGHERVDITISFIGGESALSPDDVLTLHELLERLTNIYPQHAEVVLLHYFAGLTLDQVAEVIGVSLSSIERRWRFARAWLQAEMASEPARSAG